MKFRIVFLVIIVSFLTVFADAKKDEDIFPLSKKHSKWLEEVYWIISDYERNAFRSLQSDEDRDRFIEVFWDSRDPTPGTKKNEFKNEHYERFEYAVKHLGRETTIPGWKTDRGRTHILMGKPEYIKRFNNAETHPMELWHYVGYKGYGLPSSLYLLFWQEDSLGAYRLHSPLSDGMRDLFIETEHMLRKSDEDLHYDLTRLLDPELAHAVYSPIPTEGGYVGDVFGPMEAEIIAAKLQNARNYQVEKREYVDDFLKGRPFVKVYYSIGTEGIRDGIYWAEAPNGYFYFDYSVEYEPDKLELGNYEDDYYASLSIDSLITGPDQEEIDQIVGTHEIKLTKEQFEKVRSIPFQYQGRRPIVPGKYSITMVVSNNVSQNSSTFVHELDIPDMSQLRVPYMTPLIPVRSVEASKEPDAKIRPFQFGKQIVIPNLPAEFPQNGSLRVYHQVAFPDQLQLETAPLNLHYKILANKNSIAEERQAMDLDLDQVSGGYVDVLKEIPLSGVELGAKQVLVELIQEGKVLASAGPMDFTVVPQASTSVWKFSVAVPGYDSAFHSLILGQQMIRHNKPAEARNLLEAAHRQDSESLEIALQLMRLALKTEDFDRVLELGVPFEIKSPRNTDLLWLMGWAHYGKNQFQEASRFFERLRIEDASRVEVFNLLADIYLRLNQPDKSLERIQQSLALRPEQPDILELKKKIESNR